MRVDQSASFCYPQAVFLVGVQLLTVDEKIPGPSRERLLVSYYRYSGQAGHNSHVDTVCELLRQEYIEEYKPSLHPCGQVHWVYPG